MSDVGYGQSTKKKKETETIRIVLNIEEAFDSDNNDSYPEYDFSELCKKLKAEKKDVSKNNDTSHLLIDESSAEALARHYEEKYGNYNDYAELGEGYNEDDSFIDNSEAINDLVPNGVTTEFGGFYINRGKLNLVKDDNLSSSSHSEDVERFFAQKRKKSRQMLSDDEDDPSGESGKNDAPSGIKKRKRSTEGSNRGKALKKPRKTATPRIPEHLLKKQPFMGSDFNRNMSEIKKNRQKSEALVKQNDDGTLRNNHMVKAEKTNTNKAECSVKPVLDGAMEVIEAVATGADLKSEKSGTSSKSSSSSSSSDSSSSDSDSDSSESEDEKEKDKSKSATVTAQSSAVITLNKIPTPQSAKPDCSSAFNSIEDLSKVYPKINDELRQLMMQIYDLSRQEKNKMITMQLNNLLISLEKHVREFKSFHRNEIYDQVAIMLHLKKGSVYNRIKKLQVAQEESKMTTPLRRLKEAVASMIPTLQSNYLKEFTKAAGTRNLGVSGNMPQPVFPWDDTLRGYLREIIRLRVNCFHIIRPRKESVTTYVQSFLEQKVKPFWPNDWITVEILFREGQYPGLPELPQKQPASIKSVPQTSTQPQKPPPTPSVNTTPNPIRKQPITASSSTSSSSSLSSSLPSNSTSNYQRKPSNDAKNVLVPRKPNPVPTLPPGTSIKPAFSRTPSNSSPSAAASHYSSTSNHRPSNSPSSHPLTVQTIELTSGAPSGKGTSPNKPTSPIQSKNASPAYIDSDILNLTKNSSVSISKVPSSSSARSTSPALNSLPLPSGTTISPTPPRTSPTAAATPLHTSRHDSKVVVPVAKEPKPSGLTITRHDPRREHTKTSSTDLPSHEATKLSILNSLHKEPPKQEYDRLSASSLARTSSSIHYPPPEAHRREGVITSSSLSVGKIEVRRDLMKPLDVAPNSFPSNIPDFMAAVPKSNCSSSPDKYKYLSVRKRAVQEYMEQERRPEENSSKGNSGHHDKQRDRDVDMKVQMEMNRVIRNIMEISKSSMEQSLDSETPSSNNPAESFSSVYNMFLK